MQSPIEKIWLSASEATWNVGLILTAPFSFTSEESKSLTRAPLGVEP